MSRDFSRRENVCVCVCVCVFKEQPDHHVTFSSPEYCDQPAE